MQSYPLQILTNSTVGSGNAISVTIYTEFEVINVRITFSDPPQYFVVPCAETRQNFTDIPVEDTIVWTMTLTNTSLALACNSVEVFNNSLCGTTWSGEQKGIMFMTGNDSDTASILFRAKPPGKSHTKDQTQHLIALRLTKTV